MGKKFTTRLTEMLDLDYPILCGGMQGISKSEFVADVCNAGGLGFITAESFETPEDLRADLKRIRTMTDRPFGVNVSMIPEIGSVPERTLELVRVICEEGVPVVETAGRSPAPLMPQFKEAGVRVIHKLTSVRHAVSAQKAGVDAVALLGFGSGGHIGMSDVASFISIPLAVKRLDIPVIVAGGVADGRGFLAALAMGAEGVLMGTRFLTTEECPVFPAVKEKYVEAEDTDTILIMSSIMNPMRCVKNKLSEEVLAMEAKGTTLEEIVSRVRGGRMVNALVAGDVENAMLPAGQVTGLIDGIKTVKEVIQDIIAEAEELLDRLNKMTS